MKTKEHQHLRKAIVEYMAAMLGVDARVGRPGGLPAMDADGNYATKLRSSGNENYPYEKQEVPDISEESDSGKDYENPWNKVDYEDYDPNKEQVFKNAEMISKSALAKEPYSGDTRAKHGHHSRSYLKFGVTEKFDSPPMNTPNVGDKYDSSTSDLQVGTRNSQHPKKNVSGDLRSWAGGFDPAGRDMAKLANDEEALSLTDIPDEEEITLTFQGFPKEKSSASSARRRIDNFSASDKSFIP